MWGFCHLPCYHPPHLPGLWVSQTKPSIFSSNIKWWIFFCLLTFSFLFSQQNPQRHSVQDPHPAVFCAFPTQHGLPGRLMAGALHECCWPLHLHSLLPALLLACLLHMDGSGGLAPLPEYRQGLPKLYITLYAEVVSGGMGWVPTENPLLELHLDGDLVY